MSKHTPKNLPLTQEESEQIHAEALNATVSKPIVIPNLKISASRRADMDLDDTFTFGKYKDKRTLEYVMEHDMDYIDWLTDNNVVYFTEEAYEYLEYLKGEQ